ncbi:MAG TPA: TonB-dependent receptor [Bryobacteraceae bacterium]|jgi:iron complex outermembrane receptor protein|nr:TonB-dependent receptor [Bryobacteraceae bacterium]
MLPPALLAPIQAQFNSVTFSNNALPINGTAPEQQFGIQSFVNVSSRASFDNSIYYVGRLDALDVPAYVRVDARFGYKLRKGVQLSLVGQNLSSPQHIEFGDLGQATVSSEIPRSVFGSIAWSF